MFSLTCSGRVAPMMADETAGLRRSQARATDAGVYPAALASSAKRWTGCST